MSRAVSIGPAQESPIGTTLERHLLDRQRRMPDATGDFTGLFQQLSLAAKIIGSRVSKAGLSGISRTHRDDQRPGRAGSEAR